MKKAIKPQIFPLTMTDPQDIIDTIGKREIKFRAWNKELQIMVCENEDDSSDFWDGTVASYVQMANMQFCNWTYVWMQFTGLHDKNGKEIYAGDIVSLGGNVTADNSMGLLPNGWTFEDDNIFVVVWDDKICGWSFDWSHIAWDDVEKEFGEMTPAYKYKYMNHARSLLLDGKTKLIGNIFENPDLFSSFTND